MPSETKTETQLENLLFGADVDFTLPTLPFTFEIDNTGDVPGAASDSKPVWVDDEVLDVNLIDTRRKKLRLDENETLVSADVYQQRLRTQFQKLHPVPEWANAPSTNDLPFLGNQSSLIKQTSQINSDFLNISRLKDANQADRCKSIVSSLQFHPTAPVMFTSGLDKTLRLFNIDGRLNLKISSTYFADLPITKAKFTIDGQNIICVGRKKYFYNYDIESGSVSRISHIRGREEHSLDKHFISPCNKFIVFIGMNGSIILLCRKTMQLIDVFKMNSNCKDICFTTSYLLSFGGIFN